MRRLPPLRALQAFEAAARLGRMTLAAEELGVTHGAISRQVRLLEERLGLPLFEGPKNALRPTEAGQRLLGHLTAGLDEIASGVRAVSEEAEGTLDVSCPGTLAMRWLIPRLHRWQAAHPGIEVRLVTGDGPVDFRRLRADVALRGFDRGELEQARRDAWPPDGAGLRELFEVEVGPVATPALVRRLKLRRPADLARATLLHAATRRSSWTEWAEKVGWRPDSLPGPVYEHFYFMLEAASAGLGVGLINWGNVVAEIQAGTLAAPFGFVPTGRVTAALWRDRRSRKARLFSDWLAAEAAATPPAPGVT